MAHYTVPSDAGMLVLVLEDCLRTNIISSFLSLFLHVQYVVFLVLVASCLKSRHLLFIIKCHKQLHSGL